MMTHSPVVSVLTCVYNGMPYLPAAIESIRNQTLADLELILIDDASTDSTWEVVQGAAARDRRLVPVRSHRNLGAGGALNLGLSIARGEFVTRQDSDDISLPHRLARQTDFLYREPEVGAVAAAVRLIDQDGKTIGEKSSPTSHEAIQAVLWDYMCLCGPTVMARRQLLTQMGFMFDAELSTSEDYDMCLRLAENTRLACVGEPLYLYRQHGGSVSKRQRAVQMERKAIALERAVYRRHGSHGDEAGLAFVARDYLRAAVLAYASEEPEEAQRLLVRALAVKPTLFLSSQPLEEIVYRYAPTGPVDARIAFIEGIFDSLLPDARTIGRVRRRLLSKTHMAEVFAGAADPRKNQVDKHLWPGIRQDPSWLLNRGVVKIAATRLLAALMRRAAVSSGASPS